MPPLPRPTALYLTLALALVGCGPDPELERQHRALRSEFTQLSRQHQVLRQEMIEAGLVPPDPKEPAAARGKAKAKGGMAKARNLQRIREEHGEAARAFGHWAPKTDLATLQPPEGLRFQLRREGTPPALPAAPPPERTDSPCGLRLNLPELQPLSDWPLNAAGYGKSGPILLLQDGEALRPHATPDLFADRCAGAFRHAGTILLFSPLDSDASLADHDFQLALNPAFPMKRGDDAREMYWIYPGTTLHLQLDGGWREAWGPLELHLAGRVATPADAPASLKVGAVERTLPLGPRFEDFTLSEALPAPEGPWELSLSSPADGPYILLHTLTLGNAANGLVITSEEAFQASRSP